MTSRKRKLFVALFHRRGDTHLLRLHTRAIDKGSFTKGWPKSSLTLFDSTIGHNRKELGQVDEKWRMAQVCFTAAIVGLLCCLSVLNACKWDPDTALEQGLDASSFDNGAAYLAHLPEITDSEQCQSACCERDDCQLALIGTPADSGRPECFLVSCVKDGKDVCVLTESTQFKVYRRILDSPDQEPQNEAEVRSVNSTGTVISRNYSKTNARMYWKLENSHM